MAQSQQVTIPSSTEVSLKMDMPGLNIVIDALQQRSNMTQNLIASFQSQINDQILPLLPKSDTPTDPLPTIKE
jgi:polysaccharide deacetylase 2 family uncharacterized protein YibQ